MTPHPHDALFTSAFEHPAHAGPLLRAVLPTALGEVIAWDRLKGEPGSFIDVAFAGHRSDLLFSTRLRTGEPALLYLLFEHQSTPDPEMPLRGLSYEVQIWERFRREHRGEWLPPIIAVVLSHVPGGWTAPRSLADMFDPSAMAIPEIAALVPRFSLIIEDLAHLTDEELRARTLAAFPLAALWLLRDAHDPVRLLRSFDTWSTAMLEAYAAPGGFDSLVRLVRYILGVVGPAYRDAVVAKIRQLGTHTEEIIMTIADQIHMEGREEGRMEGREEGRMSTLRHLLLFKFKLASLDDEYDARLRSATPEAIDRYFQRLLSAESLAAVFEDG